ncbi:hypothetical protein VP511E551_P0020 [Vibrio phage 511E55-1]|nr:hypothetical protein VP511E551_P0020 [Vibrio phage 511E55-1]
MWDLLAKIFLSKNQRRTAKLLSGRSVQVTRNGGGFYDSKSQKIKTYQGSMCKQCTNYVSINDTTCAHCGGEQ